MTYTVRPISDRTLFTGKHQRSQFDAPWSKTEGLLMREVAQLRGRHLVVEVDVTESEIRNDGRIRATARPASPAVRVAFESMHGDLTYGTDRFSRWQDNVRAIALGLEALRKVDRYGITKRGEQYAGWKALPAGRATPASHMTRTDAIALIERVAIGDDGPTLARTLQRLDEDADLLRRALREAKAMTHPDRRDGDRTMWDQVEQAAHVLGVAS